MSTADMILSFASSRSNFTLCEVADFVRERENITDSGILWHLKKLIKQNRLSRISRGMYGDSLRKEFVPFSPMELKKIYKDVTKAFPLIDVVVYSGEDITALQHHISANNVIYLEVTKEATDAVFHYLTDRKIRAYHKPTAYFINDYIDLGEKSVIVKSLVTEAPIKEVNNICMPTLEKILVDVNADSDFYYLQGNETFYMMKNALSQYSLNVPKMMRYASRRGIRDKMQMIMQKSIHYD